MQSDQNRWENDKRVQVIHQEGVDAETQVQQQPLKQNVSPLLVVLIGVIIVLALAIVAVIIGQQLLPQNTVFPGGSMEAKQIESVKDEMATNQNEKAAQFGQDSSAVIVVSDTEASLIAEGDPLEGNWVRYDDEVHVAGMTVSVVNKGGVLEGHIIQMKDGIGVFNIGQVKWHNIRKISENRYELDDLFTHYNGNWTVGDVPSHITIIKSGQRLTLIADQIGPGSHQIWEKMTD